MCGHSLEPVRALKSLKEIIQEWVNDFKAEPKQDKIVEVLHNGAKIILVPTEDPYTYDVFVKPPQAVESITLTLTEFPSKEE